MDYELCSFPPALFEAQNVFRKADKRQLAQATSEHARSGILAVVPESQCHVLDGGSLLHREPRKRGDTLVFFFFQLCASRQ